MEYQYFLYHIQISQDNADGTLTRLYDQQDVVWDAVWARDFSFLQNIHSGSGAHQTTYLMGTKDSFPGGKMARLQSWPPTHWTVSKAKDVDGTAWLHQGDVNPEPTNVVYIWSS